MVSQTARDSIQLIKEEFGRELRRLRKAANLTQESLADRIGYCRVTITQVEKGRQDFSRQFVTQVDSSLSAQGRLLAIYQRIDTGRCDRQFLAANASADPLTVGQLRDYVGGIGERYDHAPSTSLIAEAGQCLGRIEIIRGQLRTDRLRRELLSVQCAAATLMGQLVWDASQRRDHGTTRSFFDLAIHAARRLGDRAAEGHALLRKSFIALYGEHDPQTGLDLAQETAYITRSISHVLAGLAFLHAAEAHAMLGHGRHCERALSAAEFHFARIEVADAAGSLFSPAQFDRLAGSCYLHLGNYKRAEQVLEHTAQMLQDRKKSRAIVLGNLALALIRQQNVDGAVVALHEAIDIAEQTRGGGGLNLIFAAGRELKPWRSAAMVQDVYDRLLDLIAAA